MLRAMSTYVYVRQRLHPGMLDSLVRGGAQAIEIFGARQHFDYQDKAHIREIAGWFASNNILMNSLHSPMFSDLDWGRGGSPPVNLTDPDKRRRIDAMDEVKRALEVAETLPFRFLIQHLGIPGDEFDDRKFDAALTSLEHLHAFAHPLGVTLLIENIPNETSTPERLLEFLRVGHFDKIGVCFDVGHAHLAGSVAEAFNTLKAHIRSSHVHDNKADRDSHLWPGDGTIDWNEAMRLLSSAPQAPPLLMEIEGDDQTVARIPDAMTSAFKLLESGVKAA